MKIVIIGGTGLVGSKVAGKLRELGHTVIAGSPSTGINSLTGEGIAEAMTGTDIVIDLSNSPSFEDGPVMEFFETSGRNLMAAEIKAGVKHHVALSIIGVDNMPNLGYMRAKKAQEDLVRKSGLPFTIIRSSQFLEFIPALASGSIQGNEAHVSRVEFQPIAAENVASFVAEFALKQPTNSTPEIAGPECHTLTEFVATYLKATGSNVNVVANSRDEYYGGQIPNNALVPQGEAKIGAINFNQWFSSQAVKA
jgi:uncharacterized protein YbjT (DUF2867 family)